MQLVHTSTRFVVPPTTARTRWMFGFQRRLVRRCEWLTLMPNDGFLPQTSHVDAIVPGTSTRRLGMSGDRATLRLRARVHKPGPTEGGAIRGDRIGSAAMT